MNLNKKHELSTDKENGETQVKEQSLRMLLVLGLLLGFAAGAQAQKPDACVVNVPFDFLVSGTKLPAGTYKIDRAGLQYPDILVFRSSDGKFAASANTTLGSTGPSATPKLVFHRYGDEYFLSEVRTLAGVRRLGVTKLEKELAKASGQEKVSVSGGH